jgi:hypothetical protein
MWPDPHPALSGLMKNNGSIETMASLHFIFMLVQLSGQTRLQIMT